MSAAPHTQGLAHIAEETGPCVVAIGEREVAEFYQDGEAQTTEDEANARRMVACWNAADGISTEMLEHVGNIVIPAKVRYSDLHLLLDRAEAFIAGFEDDPQQQGVRELLGDIRSATQKVTT